MSNALGQRVEGWLRKVGSTPVKIHDDQAAWHFEVDYPSGTPHRVHVVGPKDRPEAVVIATMINVSPEHVKTFGELDDDDKAAFLWDLRKTLNQDFAEFTLVGYQEGLVCPAGFQITATRFEDGLSLDSFARSISSVYKTELAGIMCVQEHLGPKGYGAGGRFDFKRLGLQ
ncbi:MAG: DUF2299 family protein [Vicinamibacterales bacterium]